MYKLTIFDKHLLNNKYGNLFHPEIVEDKVVFVTEHPDLLNVRTLTRFIALENGYEVLGFNNCDLIFNHVLHGICDVYMGGLRVGLLSPVNPPNTPDVFLTWENLRQNWFSPV